MLLPVLLGGCSLPNHRPADSDARQFVDALISTNLQHIELAQKSVKQASAMMQPVRSPQTKTNITTPPATATASAPDTLRGLTRIKSLGTPETFTLVRVKALNLGLEATLNKVIPAGWTAIISADIQTQSRQRITLELFSKMSRHLPWRIRMDLMPNGLKILGGKKVVLSMAALLPPLRPVYNSVQWLEEASKSDPVCAMTICASTWGRTKETTKRNRTLLQKGLQSWGVCEVTSTFGDPLGAWVATLAGANALSIPSMMFPPLSAALALLPLQRPNTPWADDASIVFSTPDGKIFPVKLASTLQTKFTEIVAGEPGTGKSVALGALSEAILFSGQNSLPFLSYVDKGFSALGVIRLIQDALPPERKHEAVGLVLENSRNHCKNPFDVQLGMKSLSS